MKNFIQSSEFSATKRDSKIFVIIKFATLLLVSLRNIRINRSILFSYHKTSFHSREAAFIFQAEEMHISVRYHSQPAKLSEC